jgi:branched-chain amino acid transport system substrate-binding protein
MNAFSTFTRSAWIAGSLLVLATTSSLAADKVIKIGGLLPMSGPGSYFGAQDKQGVELALDQLNKSGVNGYKFEIRYEDSACSPLPASQAAKRLIVQA